MSEFKPCPFCAGTDLHTTVSGYDFWVYCATCNAEGPPADDREAAINAWNKGNRMTPEELERLTGFIEDLESAYALYNNGDGTVDLYAYSGSDVVSVALSFEDKDIKLLRKIMELLK